MKHLFNYLSLLLIINSTAAYAAEIEMDLASGITAFTPVIIKQDESFSITARNTVPNAVYSISYQVNLLEVEALATTDFNKPQKAVEEGKATKACKVDQELSKNFEELEKLDITESEYVKRIAKINDVLKPLDEEQTTACSKFVIKLTKAVKNSSFELKAIPGKLLVNRELVVKIIRYKTDKKKEKIATWTQVVTTGRKSSWSTTFGFTFVENKDRRYFTEEAPVAGDFIVTERANQDDLLLLPTIFFTWDDGVPTASGWSHGPTAGLGVDLSNPAVMAGWYFSYRKNLGMAIGVAIHKQSRLSGRYSVNETINENLDDAALHENVYKTSGFISITYRFSDSPF